ncbi:MAG: Ca-activated chloride channel [Verrucomicrobiota bacterium]
MNIDDSKLTAYALGELSDEEEANIEAKLQHSPEGERIVAETQELGQMLKSEYETALGKEAPAPTNLIDIRDDPWFWSIARPLAFAAVLALAAVIAILVIPWKREMAPVAPQIVPQSTDVQTEVDFQNPESEFVTGSGDVAADRRAENARSESAGNDVAENPFLAVRDYPHSTFPIAVGRTSYPNIERSIKEGSLPPKNAVRIGEMINYFSYDYPQPSGSEPFSVNGDVAGCPWNSSHRLVRIGVQGRNTSTGGRSAIAKDVSVEVDFNPARVVSYRLIGYEKGPVGKEDSKVAKSDSGEIPPGHTATALYEIVPVGEAIERSTSPRRTDELLKVKLHYKKRGGAESEAMERSIADNEATFESASPDFKFAAAVAEFGMILRESEFKGNATLGAVLEWAQHGKGVDSDGRRFGFIELARKTQSLKKG